MNYLMLYLLLGSFLVRGSDSSTCYRLGERGRPNAISVGISQAILSVQHDLNLFSRSVPIGSSYRRERAKNDDINDTLVCSASAIRKNDAIISTNNIARKIMCGGNSSSNLNHGTKESKKVSSRAKKDISRLPPVSAYNRPLVFWESMICGAISRSVAQTIMHPANTMKTILQSRSQAGANRLTVMQLARPQNLKLLTRGAGAQLILSLPHGAVNFAVLEFVRRQMSNFFEKKRDGDGGKFGPGLDFLSSAISTVCCSVVSTPQMVITDNIMAGTYRNMGEATSGVLAQNGIVGLYTGWWPGLVGKIPSYGLTWVFFQQLKQLQLTVMKRDPTNIENSIMGCIASATTVCIMIPMDTIKTRLVTQANYPDLVRYKGIIDCARRTAEEEGMKAFYRGLAPRLISVVPMIGIQFGIYEFMKKVVLAKNAQLSVDVNADKSTISRSLEEIAMEVAADDDQPFPVPRLLNKK